MELSAAIELTQIDEHIEWLEQQLKEIESHPRQLLYEGNPQDRTVSQIKSAIAVNQDWKEKSPFKTD
jgi:hypothetical protein